MHEIYELKEMLCKELEEYGKKGEMTAGSLDVVDKLAHTIKNLDKIIETYEEEGYSGRGGSYEGGMTGGSYARDGRTRSYAGRSYRGGSYARGRGGNARRDAMGRYSSEGYSRADDMIDQLNDLMEDAPDERTRMEIQKLITKMESM
jgi:hypothetical protein